MKEIKQESWGSRLGFLLAAGGSAVGIGNIVKFPMLAGNNGGGAFLFVYLIAVVVIGVSLLLAEFVIGRSTRCEPIGAFTKLNKRYRFIGWMSLITGFLIMGYYPVIGGWALAYIFKPLTGAIHTTDITSLENVFTSLVTNPIEPIIWALVFLVLSLMIVIKGIDQGIEKASKILMPLLFITLILLGVRSITLEGAEKGLEFFLKPDFTKMTPLVILQAIGQVFFSLGLAMGIMITYGSYLDQKENLTKNAFIVSALDTVVAFMAGLIILPAVFAFNHTPEAGLSIAFNTIPAIFATMGSIGNLLTILFFILLSIAALTSSVSLLEVTVAFFIQRKGYSRKKAVYVSVLIMGILSIFASLSNGAFNHVTLFGKNIFDLYDYVTSTILLPLGALFIALFIGWKTSKTLLKNEITSQGQFKGTLFNIWYLLIRYLIPIVLVILFAYLIGII